MFSRFVIFGAGPTGLTAAFLLKTADPSSEVHVYEASDGPGGTWATRPVGEEKRFTQHSPQVVTSSYVNAKRLFKAMPGCGPFLSHFEEIKTGWLDLMWSSSSWKDVFQFANAFVFYMAHPGKQKQVTVEHHFKPLLTPRAYDALHQMCYILDGVGPDTMTMTELMGTLDTNATSNLYLPKTTSQDPDGFVQSWFRALQSIGVVFHFGARLDSFSAGEIKCSDSTVVDCSCPKTQVVLAMDPINLVKVLDHPDTTLRENWGPYQSVIRPRLTRGLYVSLSVTLAFERPLGELPAECEYGFSTAWNIIAIPLEVAPKRTIMSCAILDLDAVSQVGPVAGKALRDCSPEEVKQEVWRQLSECTVFPENPKSIDIGTHANWDKVAREWTFSASSSSQSVLGHVDPYGHRSDIAIVGPINQRSFPPTTLEAAVESAYLFAAPDKNPIQASRISATIQWMTVLLITLVFIAFVCKI